MSTLELSPTRDFWENVLGFKPVVQDIIEMKDVGQINDVFFDVGHDQLVAFMEARDLPEIPREYDAEINRGLGVRASFYHFAFEAGNQCALEAKRQ